MEEGYSLYDDQYTGICSGVGLARTYSIICNVEHFMD